ncbi:hypothetical protein QBC38DRAFT_478228 [Podospora fimiseda]|uniref:Uncharacterized protein n=1 Tax=Podospora fimiseda TaxID=252190 RepID=A0AAN7GUE0_9PEZI|nr:hypothetical protein QBC38DRAFT_478228 [Podospora fimiseda]
MEPPSPHQPNTPTFPSFPSSSKSTLSRRRAALSPEFQAKLTQMSLRLAPLVQLTSGQIHPHFPQSLLCFWLLTESQLDSLAHFYHQRTPCEWTRHYPCPVYWPSGLTLEEKRRKLGKFIGLRGCDTPVVVDGHRQNQMSEEVWLRLNRTEEEVERDARLATEREEEERAKWY